MIIKLTLFFKLLPIILLFSGCFATQSVYDIGYREVHGTKDLNLYENNITIYLFKSSIIRGPHLRDWTNSTPIDTIEINLDDIDWFSEDKYEKLGSIKAFVKTDEILFDVKIRKYNNGKEKLILVNEQREWYGYPAQALMVVSMPLDLVLDVVLIFWLIITGVFT